MSIQGTLQDREFQKFVESPTRPGNAVPEVVIGSTSVFTFSASANTRPTVTNVSAAVLASNTNRKYACFSNNTNVDIFIKLGATAVVDQGIVIKPGQIYEIKLDNLFTGSVNAIKLTAASVNLDVFEGT